MKRFITLVVGQHRAVAALNGVVIHDARYDEEYWDRLAELTPARKVMVLLCPDLCEARVLNVPPLREAELQTIVQRDVRRYFLSGDDDSVTTVGVTPIAALGLCVRADTLRDIHTRAGASHFSIHGVASTYEAWAARSPDGITVVDSEQVLEIMYTERGRIRELRQIPATRDDLLPEGAQQLPGDAMHHAALETFSPAIRVEALEHREARLHKQRRTSAFAWAATLALLIGAALLENWGLARELDHVREARASIATYARPAIAVQQSAQAGMQVALAATELEQSRSHLARLVANAADRMPDNAQLVAVQARRDTVSLEILAADAVETIEALKEIPMFSRVRVVGSIRRQEHADGSTRDQFVISMPTGSRGRQ